MRPFGCLVTILNTLDPLGKFQGKVDEGFLVRYSVCSKAFRVFNSRTRIIQETLHVNFMENKPTVAGSSPAWLGAQTRKQGDKTENKDMGKSPVVTITGFSDLNAEFEEYNNNSSNGVNAASSLEEPKRVHQALNDPSWTEAMQEELLQFKMQKVWILVDLPYGKR
nr:retrovirus-related Pol polyprotein from transposon TNT 1-94 [Tanacetum cinerariifolium]